MNNLWKIKNELFLTTKAQKKSAWVTSSYEKAQKIREKERENYEKYKLLEGLIKATKKGNKKL